jgi:hypothetical protein
MDSQALAPHFHLDDTCVTQLVSHMPRLTYVDDALQDRFFLRGPAGFHGVRVSCRQSVDVVTD